MIHVQTILDALLIEPTPNVPAQYYEDKILYEKEALLEMVNGRLQGEPAARDLAQRFMENPAVWESAFIDALNSADALTDDDLLTQAQTVIKVAKSLQPAAKQAEHPEAQALPATLPGVLLND